ncbi:hypothetical protein OBBRIDRAFT_440214 [Obba rivulosa]|uniref:Uncharacterized protein n=1 Tax=Obba rivulosa TaxID=1052685 RepID=A0A8E2DU32_9APHY|nr:hypothetical protein OBBRIDRAFT_440214 [Obba rivulosa]
MIYECERERPEQRYIVELLQLAWKFVPQKSLMSLRLLTRSHRNAIERGSAYLWTNTRCVCHRSRDVTEFLSALLFITFCAKVIPYFSATTRSGSWSNHVSSAFYHVHTAQPIETDRIFEKRNSVRYLLMDAVIQASSKPLETSPVMQLPMSCKHMSPAL